MSNLRKVARRCALPLAAVAAALSLSSCGGGDPYTGLWEGTLDGNIPVKAILLSDGTYYLQHVKFAGPEYAIGGVVRGSGDFQGATFKSIDAWNFRFGLGPEPARITGKLGGHQTVTGAMNGKPLTLKYTKPFDPHGVLADLAGTYPGQVIFARGLRETTFEVTKDGALSTTLNGCSITGRVVPRADDAFDLTIKFGGAPCVFPGAEFSGAAMYSQDLKQLEAAVVNKTYAQPITFTARRGD